MNDDNIMERAKKIARRCTPIFEPALEKDARAGIVAGHLVFCAILASIKDEQIRKSLTAQFAISLLDDVETYRRSAGKNRDGLLAGEVAGHA